MTRNGKIARLPKVIRNELNQRLDDGEPGVKLVDWLNALPEVQTAMQEHFEGREINEVNLSEWKSGGFLEWQARQQLLADTKELVDEAEDIESVLSGSLTKHLGTVVAARYAQLLKNWNGEVDEAFEKKLKIIRLLSQEVAVLRRADLAVSHQALRAERLELEKKLFDYSQRRDETKALGLCLDESKKYPEAEAAFRQAFALQEAYVEGRVRAGRANLKSDAGRAIAE